MRIETGEYLVEYYNSDGLLIDEANSIAGSLMQSHEKAAVMLARPVMKYCSYTIKRCVFDSQFPNASL